MARYSLINLRGWVNLINEYHPDDEVREEAWYLVQLCKDPEKTKKNEKYITVFIDDNKFEAVKNKPLKINK